MPLPKLETLLSLTGAGTMKIDEVPVATKTVTVAAAGDYYLTSTTALLSQIGTRLTTAGAPLIGTYTVSIDDNSDTSTGKVTISATGITSFAITWTDTALRDLLGFTGGSTSPALTVTGANQSTGIWLPNAGRGPGALAPDGDTGLPMRDLTVIQAPDGTTYSMSFQTPRYRDRLTFPMVQGNKAYTSQETVVNEALQTFWTNGLSKGFPFRYHKSRDTDGTYVTWVCTNAASLGTQFVDPRWVGSSALSAVSMDVVQWV